MIVVKIGGGLGNQMFMCAYAKMLEKRGMKVRLDVDDFFEHDQNEIMKTRKGRIRHIIRKCDLYQFHVNFKTISKTNCLFRTAMHWNLFKKHDWASNRYFDKYLREMVCLERNAYVYGYFANEKFFKRYRKDILEMFTPKQKVEFPVALQKERRDCPLVSVHFRRTDYKYADNLDIVDLSYYMKAIQYLKDKIGEFDICAFSDDVEWVKEHFSAEGIRIFYPGDYKQYEDYEELILMSKCDHNIIANSTFSWWAAWLNTNSEKIVIAPQKWLNNRKDRMVPKEWIRM